MLASQIRDRARSLSDLENSQAISYTDEIRSINESYKDIYNELCITDFDYNIEEEFYPTWSQYVDPNNDTQYILPLPTDFYQLRFVDYYDGASWRPMTHMNINQRDINSSDPIYRLKNSSLFIVVGTGGNVPSNIKVSYYPAPDTITFPDLSKSYNMTLEPYKAYTTTANWYIPPIVNSDLNTYSPDIMLYNYNNTLIAESLLNQTSRILLAFNVTQVEYYKGYIYYLYSGSLYRGPYDPNTSTSIAATIITLSGVSISSILTFNIYNNTLYASNATTSIQANLDGTSSAYYMGTIQPAFYPSTIKTSYQIYINDLGNLTITGGGIVTPLIIDSGLYLNLSGNGNSLYALEATGIVYKIDIDITDPLIPVIEKTILTNDVSYIGSLTGDRVSVIREDTTGNEAVSAFVDYDLYYPSNALYEIMAYQTAVDFKRKYDTNNADLNTRLGNLWKTFMNSMIKQDQYKTERIQNVRNIQGNYNWNR